MVLIKQCLCFVLFRFWFSFKYHYIYNAGGWNVWLYCTNHWRIFYKYKNIYIYSIPGGQSFMVCDRIICGLSSRHSKMPRWPWWINSIYLKLRIIVFLNRSTCRPIVQWNQSNETRGILPTEDKIHDIYLVKFLQNDIDSQRSFPCYGRPLLLRVPTMKFPKWTISYTEEETYLTL